MRGIFYYPQRAQVDALLLLLLLSTQLQHSNSSKVTNGFCNT
uniref:Uncharacterized protein n=1 Tax=Rhizophora mucronata TaxID=61149 RepID=A0A2P2QH86_RHIMU